MPEIRQTAVCRNKHCKGGGWWGKAVPLFCPNCKLPLIRLSEVIIIDLKEK